MTARRTPEPPARARDADATRQDLLHAAMRRFTVLGYDRTTSRDIAADAGVNVSLINRYFGSKDGLFAAVMQESAQSMSKVTATGPDELVESMLERMDPASWPEYGHEHPLLLLLRAGGGTGDRSDELRRRSLETITTQLAALAAVDGPADTDAHLRAELVLALVAGVLTLRAALPDGALAEADTEPLRAALARTTSAILHGR